MGRDGTWDMRRWDVMGRDVRRCCAESITVAAVHGRDARLCVMCSSLTVIDRGLFRSAEIFIIGDRGMSLKAAVALNSTLLGVFIHTFTFYSDNYFCQWLEKVSVRS